MKTNLKLLGMKVYLSDKIEENVVKIVMGGAQTITLIFNKDREYCVWSVRSDNEDYQYNRAEEFDAEGMMNYAESFVAVRNEQILVDMYDQTNKELADWIAKGPVL